MSEVTFDEEQFVVPSRVSPNLKPPLFIRLVISSGIASNQKDAEKALLVMAGITALVAIGIYVLGKGNDKPRVPDHIPLIDSHGP